MPMSVVVLGEPVRGTSIEIVNGVSSSITASNVGTGNGVYKQQVGSNLEFKSLVSGSGITITNNTNDLTINSSAGDYASIIAGLGFVPVEQGGTGTLGNKVYIGWGVNQGGASFNGPSLGTGAGGNRLRAIVDASALGDFVFDYQLFNEVNKKQDTIIGAASTITSSNLSANRAVMTNASGKIIASSVTDAELYSLTGVSGGFIQTQLNTLTAAVATKISNPLTATLSVPTPYAIQTTGGSGAWYMSGSGLYGTGNAEISTTTGGITSSSGLGAFGGGIQTGYSGVATGEVLKFKVMVMPSWDMDATATVTSAPHGINYTKIRSITGIVLSDDASTYTTLDSVISANATNFNLYRLTGGIFDNTSYDSTIVTTRGYIFIWYAI